MDIQVVYVTDGRGICGVCGNGLWPGQPPCVHRQPKEDESDGDRTAEAADA